MRKITQEEAEAIRQRNLAYYRTANKEVLQKRWNNISNAKKQRLTSSEILKIEEHLKLGYVKDKKLLLKKAGINKSYRLLDRYIEENPEWLSKFNLFEGQMDWRVQNLSPEEFQYMLQDLEKLPAQEIKKKWKIGLKTEKRLRDFYNIDINYRKGFKQSKPEKIIESLLEDLDIIFQKEKNFNKGRFRVDFLLQNKIIIEVQGDYWHGNPKFYSYEKFTNTQWQNYYNDWFKKDFFELNGYKIIYIWEYDIYNNCSNIIKQLIKL